jgi:hypothetical protein
MYSFFHQASKWLDKILFAPIYSAEEIPPLIGSLITARRQFFLQGKTVFVP